MNKVKFPYVGIDISKDTFNAHFSGSDFKYRNTPAGFRKFAKQAPANAVYAMEATGNYHRRLADYLHLCGRVVKVANPNYAKRWIQSQGAKAKTDKADAKLLADYAKANEKISEWKPMTRRMSRARSIISMLSSMQKALAVLTNSKHALSFAVKDKDLLLSMELAKSNLAEQAEELEKELFGLVSAEFPQSYRNLLSIPGIGEKTASILLVCFRGFDDFETAGKAASFIGIAPTTNQSGVSVKGKGAVSKRGNPYARSILFMCSLTAISKCRPCKELFTRLTERGKAKKLALVAVMHRLLKIAFGVVKSGEAYRGGRSFAADLKVEKPT